MSLLKRMTTSKHNVYTQAKKSKPVFLCPYLTTPLWLHLLIKPTLFLSKNTADIQLCITTTLLIIDTKVPVSFLFATLKYGFYIYRNTPLKKTTTLLAFIFFLPLAACNLPLLSAQRSA